MKNKLVIGVIPDGNRKYAERECISLDESYLRGAEVAFNIVKEAEKRGDIRKIVFYALAAANLQRTQEEIIAILGGIRRFRSLIENEYSVQLKVFGDSLPLIQEFFADNDNNLSSSLEVDLLINYSPEWDLATKPVRTDSIEDLDVIIRTNSTVRLSGFLPKQSAYAIIVPVDTYWPEFTVENFNKVVDRLKEESLNYKSGI